MLVARRRSRQTRWLGHSGCDERFWTARRAVRPEVLPGGEAGDDEDRPGRRGGLAGLGARSWRGRKPDPELERLSDILRTFNDQFGNIDWTDPDRVQRLITEDIPGRVAADEAYQNA